MMPFLFTFASAPAQCVHDFLGLIPWFQFLNLTPYPDCSVNSSTYDLTNGSQGTWNQLWLVGIALVDDLLRIAGFIAVAMIIYGAIRYLTSQGEPENIKGAQSTILNAIIGLVIALIAINVVSYLGNQLGGTVGPNGIPVVTADGSFLTNILNIVDGLIGTICLLMITLGGFKYVTSGGDSGRVNSAKNTILYALIGLAISIFAFIIVNFLILKLSS